MPTSNASLKESYFRLQSDFFDRPRYITNVLTSPSLNLDLSTPKDFHVEYSLSEPKPIPKAILKVMSRESNDPTVTGSTSINDCSVISKSQEVDEDAFYNFTSASFPLPGGCDDDDDA